jgi:hypothetical protein
MHKQIIGKMIEKLECEAALRAALKRTSYWRDSVAKRFPADPRSLAAAEMLRQMAKSVSLSDDLWARLEPYYDRASDKWADAVSETGRRVGIKPRITDFASYASTLADLLEVAQ